jgi:hypothetical protein
MTEAIKQWVIQQSQFAGNRSCDHAETVETYFGEGLTRGIEIAEGFAEWVDDSPYYKFGQNSWLHVGDSQTSFTTSQLLEKYIESKEEGKR